LFAKKKNMSRIDGWIGSRARSFRPHPLFFSVTRSNLPDDASTRRFRTCTGFGGTKPTRA
jgi:hypothetical protein